MVTIANIAADEPYATQIGPFGNKIRAENYTADGVPVLRGVNIASGRFNDDNFVFISEGAADDLAAFQCKPDDVLLVHKGTLGQVGIMPHRLRFNRYIMGNSMMRVRCNPEKVLPKFLYYWLRSPGGQNYLQSRISQVGVPQLQRPLTTLRQAEFRCPSTDEQQAIVNILDALDEKIEANRRSAIAIERLARAIFRAWFFDFEPVKAKIDGANEFPLVPEEIFSALPERFVQSDMGPIPNGWALQPLSSACSLVSGGTPKRSNPSYWGGDVPWYSVKDVPENGQVWCIRTEESISHLGLQNSAAQIVPRGTTIISARGTVGKLAMAGQSMAFNQSCYGLLPIDQSSYNYLYLLMETTVSELQQRTHGSVFDTITRATFDAQRVVAPPSGIVHTFDDLVRPFFDTLFVLARESTKLAELREYLLPRLINGQVRVGVHDG